MMFCNVTVNIIELKTSFLNNLARIGCRFVDLCKEASTFVGFLGFCEKL